MSKISPHFFGDHAKSTQYFYEVTPDRILRAVESLGERCTGRVLQLNSMENRVYEAELDIDPDTLKSPSEKFLIIKFYRPGRWTEAQILEEHQFLLDLREEEIPVVAPLTFDDGRTLHREEESGIFYAVFPKAGGRSPDELNNEQLDLVGRLLARVHLIGKRRESKTRLRLTPESYGIKNVEFLRDSGSLPQDFAPHYDSLVRQLVEIATPWFKEVSFQRVHGDCHLGNLIWGREGLALVDFDDTLVGPCVQDMWLMLPGRDEEAKRHLKRMLNAYDQLRTFNRNELCLIEPLRALRLIHYSAWIARRWEDPAFPRAFPHFGTNQYWKEQVADISEILQLIRTDAFYFMHNAFD